MRHGFIGAAALLGTFCAVPAWAQIQQLPACTSHDGAQLLMQGNAGGTLPDGCRRVTIRRLDTPAGAVCALEFGRQDGGVVDSLRDAVATTEWWTACANLKAP